MIKFLKMFNPKSDFSHLVCGLDEAGRGALAGPLVAAAVVFLKNWRLEDTQFKGPIRDSKKLTNQQRKKLFEVIKKHALEIELEIISVKMINRFGIQWANLTAFRRLIFKLEASQYLIDGRFKVRNLKNKAPYVFSVIRGDEKIPSVLAAGVVAKVERDRIMEKLDQKFPSYFWLTNTGHGTKKHIQAIIKYGETNYHRHQFVATALKSKFAVNENH
jgi:ribonuclease HII